MALSAQEPVIYCLHGFVSFLLGRYFHVSCNMVFKVTNAYKSYGIMCINHETQEFRPQKNQTNKKQTWSFFAFIRAGIKQVLLNLKHM